MPTAKRDIEQALLMALACGKSITDAAVAASCSPNTVRRRLAEPDFRAKVIAARNELTNAAIGRLASYGIEAADELRRLMLTSPNDSVRVGSARTILQHMVSGYQISTLVSMIEGLQHKISAMESGPARLGLEGSDEGLDSEKFPESSSSEDGDVVQQIV